LLLCPLPGNKPAFSPFWHKVFDTVCFVYFRTSLAKMKSYYIFCCLILTAISAQAQEHEVGGWLGVANYFGTLNTTFSWKEAKPAGGVFYRYNINKRWAAKAMVSYGQVAGDDSKSSEAFNRQRNLSFRSNVADICGTFEFNFFKWNKNNPKHNGFTPYIATGFGMFFYNPEAFYNGKWYYLQPLGTEGQNDPSYSGVKKYKLYAFEIPIEAGFKIHLKKNWNMNIFASWHNTFTKYLDDANGTYASTASLPGGSHGIAAKLADRSGEVNDGLNIGKVGVQRGNQRNDNYAFVGIIISYTFMSLKCPPPGETWPYR
jgi:hypothetical protein